MVHMYMYILLPNFYCPYSVKRGIGYFLFDKGSWQQFQLQYCPCTHCMKCYITIHHTEHPPRDQLPILYCSSVGIY